MGDHCRPRNVYNSEAFQKCNYLQAMEGGMDSSHVSFLHSGDMHRDPLHRNTKGAHYQSDQKPKFEMVKFSAGCSSPRGATPSRGITTGASPSGSCPGTRWRRPAATTR